MSLDSVNSLFNDSFRIYQERFATLTEIVLLPVLFLFLGYVLVWLGSIFALLGLLATAIGWVMLIFCSLAIIYSVDKNTSVDASYRAIKKYFWPLIWISVLATCSVIGGMMMLFIPGIWLLVAFMLRSYVLVLEDRKGMDALRQSKDYIEGYWWPVLGRTFLFLTMTIIISVLLQLPFGLLFGFIGKEMASTILILFTVPFASIFYYKIYENLKNLKPEVHGTQPSGNTFVKVSAIIGIVGALLIVGLFVSLLRLAIRDYKNGNLNVDNWNSTSSNQLNNY